MSEPISSEDWWRIATNLDSGYISVSDGALLYDETRRLAARVQELEADRDEAVQFCHKQAQAVGIQNANFILLQEERDRLAARVQELEVEVARLQQGPDGGRWRRIGAV